MKKCRYCDKKYRRDNGCTDSKQKHNKPGASRGYSSRGLWSWYNSKQFQAEEIHMHAVHPNELLVRLRRETSSLLLVCKCVPYDTELSVWTETISVCD
jgi:hypothetical protein